MEEQDGRRAARARFAIEDRQVADLDGAVRGRHWLGRSLRLRARSVERRRGRSPDKPRQHDATSDPNLRHVSCSHSIRIIYPLQHAAKR